MKATQRASIVVQKILQASRRWSRKLVDTYPESVLELVIFHKLHLSLPTETAQKCYRSLKKSFVDWNEVRVSPIREIQDSISAAPGSLDLAIYLKDLLEFVHRRRMRLDLEFLVEENVTEIRKFLKQIRDIDPSTIDLVLRLRKSHPVLPVSRSMSPALRRLGLAGKSDTRDRQGKNLHTLVDEEDALAVHHFLLDLSASHCPVEDEDVSCTPCTLKSACSFYSRRSRRKKKTSKVGKTTKSLKVSALRMNNKVAAKKSRTSVTRRGRKSRRA